MATQGKQLNYERISVTLPPHRVVWSNVWEGRKLMGQDNKPVLNEDGSETKDFGYCAIFDDPDTMSPNNKLLWDQLLVVYNTVKEQAFPRGTVKDFDSAFFRGDDYNTDRVAKGKQPIAEIEGKICMNLKSRNRPVPMRDSDPNLTPIPFKDKGDWYAGAWAIAEGSFYCWDNQSQGMKFGLSTAMKIGDDEPIMGGVDPDAVFGEAGKKIDMGGIKKAQKGASQGGQAADNKSLLDGDRKPVVAGAKPALDI